MVTNLQVVLLAAGSDDEYVESGSIYPKNHTEVKPGLSIIELSIRSLMQSLRNKFDLCVLLNKHEVQISHTDYSINLIYPSATVVSCERLTSGAACTALLAIDYLDIGRPLLIVNADQIITKGLQEAVDCFIEKDSDAGTLFFKSTHPRWSYIRLDNEQRVVEAAEKKPISNNATAGVYYYKHAFYFIESAKTMIMKNASHNGKYYICPTFNQLVLDGRCIDACEISFMDYHTLSHPQDLESFRSLLKRPTSSLEVYLNSLA